MSDMVKKSKVNNGNKKSSGSSNGKKVAVKKKAVKKPASRTSNGKTVNTNKGERTNKTTTSKRTAKPTKTVEKQSFSQRLKKVFDIRDAWQCFRLVHYFVIAITLSIGMLLMGKVYSMHILPSRYFLLAAIVLLILPVISIVLRKKKVAISIMMVLCLMLSAFEAIGYMMVMKADATVDKLTVGGDIKVTYMEIIVMKEDAANNPEDLSGYKVGIMKDNDRTYSNNAIVDINQLVENAVVEVELDNDPTVLINELYAGNVDAIVLDDVYVGIIEEMEQYKNFRELTKVVHKVEIEEKIQQENKPSDVVIPDIEIADGAFVMYVSGIDTYGSVNRKSRSDVNILMAINTNTKKILLLNTPRDYYIPLSVSNGVNDKLTHAGNFGVQCSMDTLSMLYGIEIKYFLRMNFSGFMTIIDALGGIDVNSDYNFTSSVMKQYTFKKGMNYGLSGEEALAFARERYAFAAGDNQRGKNQMAVITAMINKLASSELLYNYTEIMDAIAGSFQTSMSSQEIYDFVKMQINDMATWSIESYAVTGTGGYSTTYSIPNMSVDIMIPNMESVETAKEKLISILTEK